jgi:hypothetical protein
MADDEEEPDIEPRWPVSPSGPTPLEAESNWR